MGSGGVRARHNGMDFVVPRASGQSASSAFSRPLERRAVCCNPPGSSIESGAKIGAGAGGGAMRDRGSEYELPSRSAVAVNGAKAVDDR